MKKVAAWSTEDVFDWLSKEGMPEYTHALRQTDGPALLRLTKADFKVPPLSRVSPDGGERLLERMEILRIETHIEDHKNGHANGHVAGIPNGTSKPQRNGTLGRKDFEQEMIHIPMPTIEPTRTPFPTEWGKTGIAFIYAVVCFVTTSVVISVVHERVPPKEHTPPLPDKFFDLFDRREWAFSICEINGMLLVGLWLIQWMLLKHRYRSSCCISAGPLFQRLYSCVCQKPTVSWCLHKIKTWSCCCYSKYCIYKPLSVVFYFSAVILELLQSFFFWKEERIIYFCL